MRIFSPLFAYIQILCGVLYKFNNNYHLIPIGVLKGFSLAIATVFRLLFILFYFVVVSKSIILNPHNYNYWFLSRKLGKLCIFQVLFYLHIEDFLNI